MLHFINYRKFRMVKKKSVKKRVKKKLREITKSKRSVIPDKKKINLVLRNLILFAVISLLSFLLYRVSNKDIFMNLFLILAIIFVFVSIAFLIILLVFVFLRLLKK